MDHLKDISALYPKPVEFLPSYGTAGFRADASLLHSTMFRCGVLMGLRAMNAGKICGIMITASHNQENDNGVKLVDCNGEMINERWEIYANCLAQSETTQDLVNHVICIVNSNPPCNFHCEKAKVVIGYDTRASSPEFASICKSGVLSVGVEVIEIGCVTTPELHYHVCMSNQADNSKKINMYILNLLQSFNCLEGFTPKNNTHFTHLHVDCANGVGAQKLMSMVPSLQSKGLILHLHNTGEGTLNYKCGADYVEKEHKFPIGMEYIEEGERCCSIDGDADRIVYFTKINGKFKLINGDRIAILLAKYFSETFNEKNPNIGIVQTAYANGASTQFIKDNLPNVNIVCTPTGVKYLHHAAKVFDIGVYFEANGHGTVLFHPKFIENSTKMLHENIKNSHLLAANRLLSQVVGDALADMLMIEFILMHSCKFIDWINMYHDIPCVKAKVYRDRRLFVTSDAERRCIKPEGLQEKIDSIVSKVSGGRCFVRPSGTEDIVRVYAEACYTNDASWIIQQVLEVI